MCHGLVAKAILSRGLVSDKIWLYGSGKDVWHSVLTDKNNKVVVDSSDGNARSIKFMADKGYGTPEDHFNFISLTLVEDLFEDYIKVS